MLKLENKMSCKELLVVVLESLKKYNNQEVGDHRFNSALENLNDGEAFGEIIPWQVKYIDNSEYYISAIDSFGGEGMGDDYWYVFRIVDKKTDEEKLVKFYGYYDSWSGVNWSGYEPYFVRPAEKVVTVYIADE